MFKLDADTLASLALHLGSLLALIVLAAVLLRRMPQPRYVAIALTGLALALAALFVDPLHPWTHALGLHWNWGGKLFSTVVIVGVMAACPATFAEMGVKASLGRGLGAALICLGVMCGLDWGVSFAFADGFAMPDLEPLLYQATMPGINEELVYRGFGMAMIDRAFGDLRVDVLGAPIGFGAVLTSLFFGIQHGSGFAHGHFMVDAPTVALTGALGFLLAWMRARTDSLAAPMIAHNLVNVGHLFFR